MATAVATNQRGPRRWPLRLPTRLPDLKGKWLTVYVAVWLLLLTVAVAAPVRGTFIQSHWDQRPTWRPYGLIVTGIGSEMQIAVFGQQAKAAGVRHGDSLIAIDGQSIANLAVADVRKLLAGAEGKTAKFEFRTPSGRDLQVRLTRSDSTERQLFRGAGVSRGVFDVALIADAIVPCFLVPAAVLLFVRRRREIVPALLSAAFLAISGWTLEGATALQDAGVPQGMMIFIGDLGFAALLLALLSFPNGRLVSRWSLAALTMIPLVFANDLVWKRPWGIALNAGAILMTALSLAMSYKLVRSPTERQQYRWAFFGFFVGIFIVLAIVPFLYFAGQQIAFDPRWMVWEAVYVLPWDWLSLAVIALGLMVSILRYRLYDADSVIGRSAAYGVLTLGFVGLFAGTENLAELIGQRYFEHSIGIAAGAIGAAVAAAAIVPLHNRVHRWAERRFQRALIGLRQGLPECVGDLRESASVDDLVRAVMTRVQTGVHSTREAVLLRSGGKWSVGGAHGVSARDVRKWERGWTAAGEQTLDCVRSDALFPMRVRLCIETDGEPKTIGWLLLGPRPDGSFFGKDEREALEHVAGPVARAIHIAQLRERREGRAEERLSTLEALIEKMAAALNGGRKAAPAAT